MRKRLEQPRSDECYRCGEKLRLGKWSDPAGSRTATGGHTERTSLTRSGTCITNRLQLVPVRVAHLRGIVVRGIGLSHAGRAFIGPAVAERRRAVRVHLLHGPGEKR